MINIHVDIDNLWVYEGEYTMSFQKPVSYVFDFTLPYVIDLFDRWNVKGTFFIIGRDLELESAKRFCKLATSRGHSIGNHTYSHRIDFCALSLKEKELEIRMCHEAITQVVGSPPIGFRAPGYYIDSEIIDILSQLGYVYDSSVLPSLANYLMSAYFSLNGGVGQRRFFGRKRYPFISRKPSVIRGSSKNSALIELPISVVPWLRLPAHPTFVYPLGDWYVKVMKLFYRLSPEHHVYLFHVLDFVNIPELEDSNSPVLALRWKFNNRMILIQEIVTFLIKLSDDSIKTTESQLGKVSMSQYPSSFLLSHALTSRSRTKI